MKQATLFIALVLALSSCMTYEKAVRKFGHLATDSTRITVRDTVIVPYDSVVFQLKTDTTTVHRIVEQGRAKIFYDRTHTITKVKAECKPDTIIREIVAKGPPQASFGIAPWYKTAFFITFGLLLVAIVSYVFLYHLKLIIAKR